MCMGGGPGPGAPPPPPPAAAPPPTLADPAVAAARAKNKQTADLAEGRAATILTSPQGDLAPADTTKKTALGL